MAADRIREDYESRLGELQTLIDLTDFDHAVDLNQMAFRQEGLAQLMEAEKKVTAAELSDSAPRPAASIAAPAADVISTGGGTAAVQAPTGNRWRDRLRKQ
jgi:hypothetical protein